MTDHHLPTERPIPPQSRSLHESITANPSLLHRLIAQVTQADTVDQVLSHAANTLAYFPLAAAILLPTENAIQVGHISPIAVGESGYGLDTSGKIDFNADLPISLAALGSFFPRTEPIIIPSISKITQSDLDTQAHPLPRPLIDLAEQMGCGAAIFIPSKQHGTAGESLTALLLLGAASVEYLPTEAGEIEFFTSIINLVASATHNLQSAFGIQRRLAELQSLWAVSQAISIETDLSALYQLLHTQVVNVMGDLDSFAVALYDADNNQIRIPYMYEEGQYINIPPFPLGQGLSSIVIRTSQPLMLVEDTERKSRELGAMIVGATAKSWLGVPLKFGGETFGLLIAQDIHKEKRFNESDQRLLSTLAAQIAVVLRNATLLETTRRSVEYERVFNEIVTNIRRAGDMRSILKITTDELAAALGAYRAHIKVSLEETN